MAIRWRRNAKPTGLPTIGAHPRGARLEDSETGNMYMFVHAEDRPGDTWRFCFWVRQPGQKPNLRSKLQFPSFKAAKEAADRYWKTNREIMLNQFKLHDELISKEKEMARQKAELDQMRKVAGLEPNDINNKPV